MFSTCFGGCYFDNDNKLVYKNNHPVPITEKDNHLYYVLMCPYGRHTVTIYILKDYLYARKFIERPDRFPYLEVIKRNTEDNLVWTYPSEVEFYNTVHKEQPYPINNCYGPGIYPYPVKDNHFKDFYRIPSTDVHYLINEQNIIVDVVKLELVPHLELNNRKFIYVEEDKLSIDRLHAILFKSIPLDLCIDEINYIDYIANQWMRRKNPVPDILNIDRCYTVSSVDLETGELKTFQSIHECCRYYYIDIFYLYRHLWSSYEGYVEYEGKIFVRDSKKDTLANVPESKTIVTHQNLIVGYHLPSETFSIYDKEENVQDINLRSLRDHRKVSLTLPYQDYLFYPVQKYNLMAKR